MISHCTKHHNFSQCKPYRSYLRRHYCSNHSQKLGNSRWFNVKDTYVLPDHGECDTRRGNGCLSVVSVASCPVEVSATSWSLVQRIPTDVMHRCVWSRNLGSWGALAKGGCCAPPPQKSTLPVTAMYSTPVIYCICTLDCACVTYHNVFTCAVNGTSLCGFFNWCSIIRFSLSNKCRVEAANGTTLLILYVNYILPQHVSALHTTVIR